MDRANVLVVLLVSVLVIGCSKKNETTQPTPTPAQTQAPVPATTASTAAPTENKEEMAKRKAIEFALNEDSYKSDPLGQWATGAKASSTFASDPANEKASWHPMRATGAPDVEQYSDAGASWASKTADSGIEWLELSYAKPVSATELRIRQNYNPGAIIKVELFDVNGTSHTVFQGSDSTVYAPNTISWLTVKFDKTPYKTQRVKITLATNAVNGYNEIDAVQLVGGE